jgi:hypothetical protein
MSNSPHLLVGCSFTDPTWQDAVPWSVEYSKIYPSYIVAKAGMGIKGICTEALTYLENLDVSRVIIILPTLWRMDIEVDQETYLCNSMVDLLYANQTWNIQLSAKRKWLTSGGLHYPKNKEYSKIFKFLYEHQGFLVIFKEHIKSLTMLLDYCKIHNIEYAVSAIQDPKGQLSGLDYVHDEICKLLDQVEYQSWLRFDGKFIDQYLGHTRHPDTKEHQNLCSHIIKHFNRGNNHGKTI